MSNIAKRSASAAIPDPPALSSRTEHNLRVARNGLFGGTLLPGYGITDDERRELQEHVRRLQAYIAAGSADEIGKAIAGLFLALTPRSDDAQGSRARIVAYVHTLAALPVWAVRKAVDDYLRGAAGDGKWCPTSVELYKAAGKHVAPYVEKISRINELLAAKPAEKPELSRRVEAVAKVRAEWGLGEVASEVAKGAQR